MDRTKVTVARWSGNGDQGALGESLRRRLKADGLASDVSKKGRSFVIRGPEPLRASASVGKLPGVSWVAAGLEGSAGDGPAPLAAELARRYLRKGDAFSVQVEAPTRALASDAAGAITSSILDAVKGARVRESDAGQRFRAAVDGRQVVVGVEVMEGPGGSPVGDEGVGVLVSGGVHSSVVALMALVAGYRVRLIHAVEGEGSLRAVAALYAELSHRGDPGAVTLEVSEGGAPAGLLYAKVGSEEGSVYGGFRARAGVPRGFRGRVESPLYLLPEDLFLSRFQSLGLKHIDEKTDWYQKPRGGSTRVFGGKTADVSEVLDGLA